MIARLKSLKYDAFRKLWHQLTPYIQIMSPRTACQHFRNGLQYNARKEEEARDLLRRFKEHLVKAKLERNYYNKNTNLAEQQRKLVDITRGKANYCSVDATAHYSYDWAQNVHVPHSDQQVSKIKWWYYFYSVLPHYRKWSSPLFNRLIPSNTRLSVPLGPLPIISSSSRT